MKEQTLFARASSWFGSFPFPLTGKRSALLWGSSGIAFALLGWAGAAWWFCNPIVLPSPGEVFAGFKELLADGSLVRDIGASIRRVLGGFLIAAGIGVPLALLMAYVRPFRYLGLPVLALLRPIPPIAWIPIAILWFGISDRSSYFITALGAFFPIFINSLSGGLSVQKVHVHAASCLGAGRWALLRRVFLPSALPMVWTGLKIGLGQAWMAVITAELVAAQSGLGYMIQLNRLQMETPRVLVGMAVIGILGALMTSVLGWVEQRLFPWNQTAQ